MNNSAPAFTPQLSQELLGFGVTDVQIDVNIPNLRVFVGLFGKVQLLLELLTFEEGVLTLGVNGSYDQLRLLGSALVE